MRATVWRTIAPSNSPRQLRENTMVWPGALILGTLGLIGLAAGIMPAILAGQSAALPSSAPSCWLCSREPSRRPRGPPGHTSQKSRPPCRSPRFAYEKRLGYFWGSPDLAFLQEQAGKCGLRCRRAGAPLLANAGRLCRSMGPRMARPWPKQRQAPTAGRASA